MNSERTLSWLYRVNGVINWTLSIRGILQPAAMAAVFGGAVPNYPSVIRLWSGFVFLFGCMFWEAGRDVRGKFALLKYNWIEKSITAAAITAGYFVGDIPPRLMLLIVLTNWLWIPVLIYFHYRLWTAMKTPPPAQSPASIS